MSCQSKTVCSSQLKGLVASGDQSTVHMLMFEYEMLFGPLVFTVPISPPLIFKTTYCWRDQSWICCGLKIKQILDFSICLLPYPVVRSASNALREREMNSGRVAMLAMSRRLKPIRQDATQASMRLTCATCRRSR